MNKQLYLDGLCFITGKGIHQYKSLIDITIEVMQGGVKWIQLRDKNSTRRQVFKTARLLKSITYANNVKLIINDHADIALAVNADGVHLGQDDLPLKEAKKIMDDKIIGISTHSIEEALEAQNGGADYIGFGPTFHTETKDAGKPKGVDAIMELKKHIHIPIVAIGGIKTENIVDVFKAGVNAVAVSSGIVNSSDISQTTAQYIELIKNIVIVHPLLNPPPSRWRKQEENS